MTPDPYADPRHEGRRDAGSLLDEIAERSLDDDYYMAHSGESRRSRAFTSLATAAMLAVFALMVTVTAIQTQRDRPATALERKALEVDVQRGRDQLSAQQKSLRDLRADVALLESAVDTGSAAHVLLHTAAGDQAVSGAGIQVLLDPQDEAMDDTSIQALVNALWGAGAEAIALNGQRIAGLTSIGEANGLITVNFRSVGAPYVFQAIGDAETLSERLLASSAGQYWEAKQKNGSAGFQVSSADVLQLPAGPPHRTAVRVAEVVKENG